ncbi:MAG TPA: baseplate J/gp47 family protein [Candidatus Limnocylindrales bacterium]|nr:baseplate J/gp47 family protein [Candidatus Limnocylindrales bacterium]
MSICYLDPEDEITGAVARIRAVEDGEAIIVLPPGSRIATSRINFRLLAREARAKGLSVVAVSDEPGVRALAISAGVAAYDSVGAAEKGLREVAREGRHPAEAWAGIASGPPAESERAEPGPRAEGGHLARARSRRSSVPEPTLVMPLAELERERSHEPSRARRRRRRRTGIAPLLVLLMLFALVGVGAYGVYALLPTATVTLRPHLIDVGPISGVVVADPRVAVVDAGEGVIPAQRIELRVAIGTEVPATGSEVTTIRATGSVRFRSENTVSPVEIPIGTRVATDSDVAFETTAAVTVPRANFGTGTPGRVDAPVRAVRPGPRGNVPANAITVVPRALAEQLVFVNNPQPTSGGARQTTTVVTEEDYRTAFEALRAEVPGQLADQIADPGNTPRGLTLYPASAQLGAVTGEPAESEVVGSAQESFELSVSATAVVLAVNEALVDEVLVEQLRALVPADATLLDQSTEASHTPGEASDGTIDFSATANARAYRQPAREALVDEIRGLPLSEARAIISRYGDAELSVWPDFIDRVPDSPARINLTILPPTEGS